MHKNNLAVAKAMGATSFENSCIEDTCIVMVTDESLAIQLVNQGIGTYYEEDIKYSSPLPDVTYMQSVTSSSSTYTGMKPRDEHFDKQWG